MNRGKTRKTLITLGVLLTTSCTDKSDFASLLENNATVTEPQGVKHAVTADFPSTPEFKPTDEEYAEVELICGSSVSKNAGDVVHAGVTGRSFFFRSGAVNKEIVGKNSTRPS